MYLRSTRLIIEQSVQGIVAMNKISKMELVVRSRLAIKMLIVGKNRAKSTIRRANLDESYLLNARCQMLVRLSLLLDCPTQRIKLAGMNIVKLNIKTTRVINQLFLSRLAAVNDETISSIILLSSFFNDLLLTTEVVFLLIRAQLFHFDA